MNKVSNDKNPTRKEFKETKKSLKTLNKDFNTKFSLFKKRLNQRDDKDSSSELFGMLNEVTGLFEQIATEATKTISLKNKQLQSNAFLMDPFKDAYEGSVIDRALFHLSTIWYNSIEYLTVSDVLKHSVQFNKEVKDRKSVV